MNENIKVPLISWSGGVDSTANVINYFANSIPFETVYIKLPNNDKQQKYELKARTRILKELTKLFGNYHIKDTVIDFVGVLQDRNILVQPYIWATALSYNIDMTKYNSLVFGYIKEDDFWHIKAEFETVIHASHKLLLSDGKVPELTFPLEWLDKSTIIEKYYNYDKEVKKILDMTYYCEGSTISCGKCNKCNEFKTANNIAKKITKK
jgi:7-cyano-7-deazaguanine synthase in queuosine biosynthesis